MVTKPQFLKVLIVCSGMQISNEQSNEHEA